MPNAEKLKGFVDWCSEHVAGDEKGEAQIFLDHLFQAIGYNGGLKESGVTLEERVSKADSGGTAFLRPGDLTPIVGNDHVAVTRDAADQLAGVFRRLVAPARKPPVDRATAQKFVLQMLVALFAEDIGLLDKYFVAQLLEDCQSPADSHDLIVGPLLQEPHCHALLHRWSPRLARYPLKTARNLSFTAPPAC
jgi:hypothetical protein